MTGQPNLGGFHRRIRIVPFPNRIVAGLEDNLHFFVMELKHADGQILDIDARAERYPWSTCIGGPEFLRKNAIGKRLDELAEIDIFQHCTHLFELAVICAGHSGDQKPVQFDLHVDDWIGDRTRVRLLIDGNSTLELDVVGRIIETPGEWAGLDVFEMCRGNHEFDVARREAAMLIGRAIYVSLGRAAPRVERPVDRGSRALGVCYSYQPSRVEIAVKMPRSRREFAELSTEPLQTFDPQKFFMTA